MNYGYGGSLHNYGTSDPAGHGETGSGAARNANLSICFQLLCVMLSEATVRIHVQPN